MITEQTKKAFQTLSIFNNKARWLFRIARGLILMLSQWGVSLYLVASGVTFLLTNAPLEGLGSLLLNSTILSAFLATIGWLGVSIGFVAGDAIFRFIFEIAHLFYPMKLRLAPFHLATSIIGVILGTFAALKMASIVTSHFFLHSSLFLNSLLFLTSTTTLLILPVTVLGLTLAAIFYPQVRQYIKESANKCCSLFSSSSFKLAWIITGYHFFSAGLVGMLLALWVSATYILTYSLVEITFQKLLKKLSQKLCYDFRDKSIALASILNLRADDPLVEELLPKQVEISSLCKTPNFMGTMLWFDYRNEQNYDMYLNRFVDFGLSSTFIKLGANALECLKRTKEEKTAENLLPDYDDNTEKKEITSVVDLKSYTLKWQAARVVAKHKHLITKDMPSDLVKFVEEVKAATQTLSV